MTQPIPAAALDHHLAILGKTGSGKSNAAKTVVEDDLDAGRRVCVLDPTGAWYGLRLTAKGKPSAYKVVIFGGQHADLPIGGAHGAAIAETVATTATPAVIDTRLMSVADRTRFFTDFAETLLRKNRGPLRLVIDEAHLFAPQTRVNDPQSGKMLHAANNLVSLGRSIGLRVVMLSQRPAKLHKDSLTQVETLVAMRLIAPQDRAAIEAWIGEWAEPARGREIIASLASLPTGDAWIWSPEIGVLKRDHFPLARTFDSGKAPTAGEAGPELQPLDLNEVTARLEQVAADVLANDPRALKAEVARLKVELAKPAAIGAPDPAVIKAAEDAAFLRGVEEGERRGNVAGQAVMLARVRTALDGLRVDATPDPGADGGQRAATLTPAPLQRRPIQAPAPRQSRAILSAGTTESRADVTLTGPQRRVLDALAWWRAFGIDGPTNEQAGFVAGYAPGSGNFNNLKGGLRAAGLIDYPAAGRIALTQAGFAIATAPAMEVTQAAFHSQVRIKLSGPQLKLLDPVLAAYPDSLSTDEIAAAAGYAAGSGNFNNLRGGLRSIGLIDYPSSGQVRAAEWLFP